MCKQWVKKGFLSPNLKLISCSFFSLAPWLANKLVISCSVTTNKEKNDISLTASISVIHLAWWLKQHATPPLQALTHFIECKETVKVKERVATCSCPNTKTPCGLIGWYGARFSPLPLITPSWKASHTPSRVVQVTQMWCHFPSLIRNGSLAT